MARFFSRPPFITSSFLLVIMYNSLYSSCSALLLFAVLRLHERAFQLPYLPGLFASARGGTVLRDDGISYRILSYALSSSFFCLYSYLYALFVQRVLFLFIFFRPREHPILSPNLLFCAFTRRLFPWNGLFHAFVASYGIFGSIICR